MHGRVIREEIRKVINEDLINALAFVPHIKVVKLDLSKFGCLVGIL